MNIFAQFKQFLLKNWSGSNGYRHILHISFPLVLSMASSTVMLFTDRLFLSHYSLDAIAAAVPASMAAALFLLTLMGASGYASVFIAQFIGAKLPCRVGSALWQSIYLSVIGGIILAQIAYLAEPLFSLANHAPEVQKLEVLYFQILSCGGGVALVGASLGCFFSGMGITRPIMVANMLAAIINIPLDYILIFGKFGFPELGIVGAGIASVCGWFIILLILAKLVFTKHNEAIFKVKSAKDFDWRLFKRMVRFGVPSGIELFMELQAATVFVFVVGYLGKDALAASNIALSINNMAFVPMIGLYTGVSVMVGQAMGRHNVEDVKVITKNSLHLGFFYMGTLALIFLVFPDFLIDLFRPEDNLSLSAFAAIKEQGIVLLMFVAFYCLFDTLPMIYFGTLKGAGDTWFVMWIMVFGCTLMCLFAWLALSFFPHSLEALWAAFTAYIAIVAVCAWLRYRQGRWQTMRVINMSAADLEPCPPIDLTVVKKKYFTKK